MMENSGDLRAAKPASSDQVSKLPGALSGGLTVLVFVIIHDLWISDIWFNVGPMVFAGALCGFVIVWSYAKAVPKYSPGSWMVYNGVQVGILVALGAVSFLVLDPKFTMAEAIVMDDALAVLIPPALPLMSGAILVGTFVLWVRYGRRANAVVPFLLTQTLLVFLVGHNLAILGLVEFTGDLALVFAEFIALTAFLGFGFATGFMLLSGVRRRVVVERE